MIRLAAGLLAMAVLAAPASAQTPAPPLPAFIELVTEGVSVFTPTEIRWALRLEDHAPLPEPPDDLADRLSRRYAREGYTRTTVRASFDAATGRLTLYADEGRIDAVVFEGVDRELAEELADAFSVRAGDIFNSRQIAQAVERVLEPTRGAVRLRPGREFDLVDRNGRRTLVINVHRRQGDFDATLGSESHEDWYSPVDGLNLAAGFAGTVYDQRRFNHTYLQAYVSYKFSRDTAGYFVGLERPIVGGAGTPRLLFNAGVYDTTASDDFWRLSIAEQSLVSLTFKNSFRDYYRERGYQIGAALQPNARHELRFSWRSNRDSPLANESDFSFFRDDEPFRANTAAGEAKLRSLVVGYTLDSRDFDAEQGRRRLNRHLGPDLFGTFGGARAGYRVEWTSEIARTAFGGDAEFSRHIGNARGYVPISPTQELRGRLMWGTSTGTLPPQRWFALGGIGSVHGYSFKESAGERMVLANVEYFLGSRRGAHALGFLDVGRVWHPLAGTEDWMKGIGVGVGVGDLRIDFGWRASDIPKSLQVLVRFGPTF